MSPMKFFNSLKSKNGIKNFFSDLLDCLDDLPSLQKKVEAIMLGTELLMYLQEDNELSDFLAGRIVVSQSTVTRFLERILARVSHVQLVSVVIREEYILCNFMVDKGPGGMQITAKIGNVQLLLNHTAPHIKADIMEFPVIKPRIPLAAFFCSIFTCVLKKFAGPERIYRRATRNIPGLEVEGNTFKLYLMHVPGLADKISREVLGIRVLDVFSVDRVELKSGKVQIYGGPRIPEKLIRKKKNVQ